jgi:hypothetical protein
MLLLLLFRLARWRRIRPDMEKYFGMRRTHIGVALDIMQLTWKRLAIQYFDKPHIFAGWMDYYALSVYDKCGGLMRYVWGFIDGTLRKTCRPTYFQKRIYSGHKRCHGLKFQSVTVPDGLMACLFGPINGNRHDYYMLAQSQLFLKLRLMMPRLPGSRIYSLYGDPAHPQTLYIFGGFRNPAPGSVHARWNTEMSRVREPVEWGYKNIINLCAFINFQVSMQIFKFPVANYFICAAFLTNLRTCFYGNQISLYFDCEPPSLVEYLALID